MNTLYMLTRSCFRSRKVHVLVYTSDVLIEMLADSRELSAVYTNHSELIDLWGARGLVIIHFVHFASMDLAESPQIE